MRNQGAWMMAMAALAGAAAPGRAAAQERGMIGIVFQQIYSETEPNHRGPLAVMHVVEGSPAEKAGVHCGEFVVAVDGEAVMGRELAEIARKNLQGPVGGRVKLSIARLDGSQSEVTVVRAPIPAHVNPASDPFSYRVPGGWAADSRYPFPLPWSPELAYHGFEDLYFSPNFADRNSPEYHSYLFFLWLEGEPRIDAKKLEADMLVYFRGLAEERGRNYHFTPDLAKVAASYREDAPGGETFGGAGARSFSGTVTIWDTHGKVITLNSEVKEAVCPGTKHTAMFFGMSLEPREGEMWKAIDAVRDTFRCGGR
ncbi:MAG TPA: PDZ domain-containing protein [Candidatus Acidoferrales bacterium]|nr:PDZ domain-containing protein [Candidatus Acidoferrales bacterium]